MGCWNWLAIQPLGCVGYGAFFVYTFGDFGLIKGEVLGDTDFFAFFTGWGYYSDSA